MSFGHLLECSLAQDCRGPLHNVDWTFNTRLSAMKKWSFQTNVMCLRYMYTCHCNFISYSVHLSIFWLATGQSDKIILGTYMYVYWYINMYIRDHHQKGFNCSIEVLTTCLKVIIKSLLCLNKTEVVDLLWSIGHTMYSHWCSFVVFLNGL